ncbi:ArpU family phage packaging/lysis transcriptional regulator [Lactiplantibacillus plantarum]|uniref:ArpU family phage packaging/lysis transcriptional regulator n=1 Tax=Lactiplantibacillus plantarum TaxID=1590 RepID=UPI0030F28F82
MSQVQDMNYGSLFPEVDEKKTIANVKKFLSVELPKMERVSHQNITNLKSPIISDLPKAPTNGNKAEITIYRKLYAEQVVKRISEAINGCDHISQVLLNRLFVDKSAIYDYQLMNELGYGNDRYYFYKNRACLQFADAYLLDDLHSYL